MTRISKAEQEKQRRDRTSQAVMNLGRAACGLIFVPPGDDSCVDNMRTLTASIMLYPKGKWDPSKLPTPIDWSAIPEVLLADTVLGSGRSDVAAKTPVNWASLSRHEKRHFWPVRYLHHELDLEVLLHDLRSVQGNWLVSRMLDYGSLYNDRPEMYGQIHPTKLQETFLRCLEKSGIGPDTKIETEIIGRYSKQSLFDISLLYDSPKVQSRLFATKTWETPQQIADTLWALSLRFVCAETNFVNPVWLKGYQIIASLLPGADPKTELDLSWPVASSLGLVSHEDIPKKVLGGGSDSLKMKGTPMCFAVLLALYCGHDHPKIDKIPGLRKLSQWCQNSIINDPDLLDRSVEELIVPALSLKVKNQKSGGLSWGMTKIIDNIASALPPSTQQEIATKAFYWALKNLEREEDYSIDSLANSYPASGTRLNGFLDLTAAQKLMDFLSKMPHPDWLKVPSSFSKVLRMFHEDVRKVLSQRVEDISRNLHETLDSENLTLEFVDKKIKLECKVRLSMTRGNIASAARPPKI